MKRARRPPARCPSARPLCIGAAVLLLGSGSDPAWGGKATQGMRARKPSKQLALPAPPKQLALPAPPKRSTIRKRPNWLPRAPKSVEAVSSYARGLYHSLNAAKKTRLTEPKVQKAIEQLRQEGVDITRLPEVQAFDQARRGAILLKRAARTAKRANWMIRWLSRRMKWEQRAAEANDARTPKTPEGRTRRRAEYWTKKSLREGHPVDGFRFGDASGDHYVLDAARMHDRSELDTRMTVAHEFEHLTQPWHHPTKPGTRFWKVFPDNEVAAFGAEAQTLGTASPPLLSWLSPWAPPPGYDAPRINAHMIARYLQRVAEVVTPLAKDAPAERVQLLVRYFDGYRAGLERERREFENSSPPKLERGPVAWVKGKWWDWVGHKRFERKAHRFERWGTQIQATERIEGPQDAYQAGTWDARNSLAPHVRARTILQAIERHTAQRHAPHH